MGVASLCQVHGVASTDEFDMKINVVTNMDDMTEEGFCLGFRRHPGHSNVDKCSQKWRHQEEYSP